VLFLGERSVGLLGGDNLGAWGTEIRYRTALQIRLSYSIARGGCCHSQQMIVVAAGVVSQVHGRRESRAGAEDMEDPCSVRMVPRTGVRYSPGTEKKEGRRGTMPGSEGEPGDGGG
jgi:hypothetical protein